MSMHIVVTTPCEASVMLDLINVVMKHSKEGTCFIDIATEDTECEEAPNIECIGIYGG